MNTQSFWILSVLAGGPQHGYGVLKSIGELSDGAVRPQVGGLYRTIDRLETDGLIDVDHEEVVDGRQRRYYRLTERGETELRSALDELTAMASVAERRLRPVKRSVTRPAIRPSLGMTFRGAFA